MNFFSILPYLTYFIFIIFFGFGISTKVNAHDAKKVPCMVDIIYNDDDVGVASYFVLKLQYKNQTGRKISGVSVFIKDKDGNLIGNSDASCKVKSDGINAGSTGQCEKVLQKISGKMMQTIGYDVWIKLLEEKKKNFRKQITAMSSGQVFTNDHLGRSIPSHLLF